MSNIRGSQWSKLAETPFQIENSRRKYRCTHGRRQDACRECGGLELAARMMCSSARARAKRANLPCTITPEKVLALIGDGICPVLGIKYDFSAQFGQGGGDASPSLDRFEPSLGYVDGNCSVISWLANQIKHNATPDQVQKVADWMMRVAARKELTYV